MQDTVEPFDPSGRAFNRCTVDLKTGTLTYSQEPCRNLEDVLGGFGRSFQILAEHDVTDAYADNNPLIMNTGLLTGTNIMTGLRTYFSSYSPLKASKAGLPAAMWSAGSGKFGSKLRWTGIDEVIFLGKSDKPVFLYLKQGEEGEAPSMSLIPADDLLGKTCHKKILELQKRYDDAHFAVIGPAGENFENCYYGAVGLSTENFLKSGDDKCRWAGRGGMGSVLGSKNILGVIAQSKDVKVKAPVEIREMNKHISSGPGSRKYREEKKGGMGGTWANYVPLEEFHMVPQNNFRPKGDGAPVKMFRANVEEKLAVKAENCFRCAIACHKNIYEKDAEGNRGKFLAKFDYEPLNLLSTNLGIHDGAQAAELVGQCDKMGMDSISLGVSIAYILDYNERHPESPLCNGAQFGEFDKIRELVIGTGRGEFPEVGHGCMRTSEKTGETSYANHVKGLELPAYLPDSNPGYPWAITGGHMSMQTYMLYALEQDKSVEYWAEAITQRGLFMVRDDLTGICKFANLEYDKLSEALAIEAGLEVNEAQLRQAVRRAFIRGMWLERKQGYQREDYTLPSQVFDKPNEVIKLDHFITHEFFDELSDKVWAVFDQEINDFAQSA